MWTLARFSAPDGNGPCFLGVVAARYLMAMETRTVLTAGEDVAAQLLVPKGGGKPRFWIW